MHESPEQIYENQFKRLKSSNYQAFKDVRTNENGDVIIDAKWLYNNQSYSDWQNYSQHPHEKISKPDYEYILAKEKAKRLGIID